MAAGAAQAAEPLPEAEVLARVNSEVIVAGDVLWEVRLVMEQRLSTIPEPQRSQIPPEQLEQLQRQLIEQMLLSRLELTLFYSDFRASVPQANLAAIHESLEPRFTKEEVKNLAEQLEAETGADLIARLRELGTSLEERRDDYYRKMIARSWLSETVKYDEEVTHDEMLEYYREHREDYAYEARSRWEELMVRFDKFPTKRDAWRAICAIGNQTHVAAQGVPVGEPAFEAVAKQASHGLTASEGGAHEWTTRGSLAAEEIDAAIFALPVGELSTILEGPSGFHIVRVLERKEAGHTAFRDVQGDIRDAIKNQRFKIAADERVTELKRGARLWTVFTGDIDTSKVAAKPKTRR